MIPEKQHNEHLLHGYNRMMERVKTILDLGAAKGSIPSLVHAIEVGKDKAVEFQELSLEEAERIGKFLRRDIDDAAKYLANTQGDLSDWLRFDLELIEERLAEVFLHVANSTSIELLLLVDGSYQSDVNEYFTDDVTGPGTLQCTACEHLLCFQKTSHIPSCPECGGNVFKRLPQEQN